MTVIAAAGPQHDKALAALFEEHTSGCHCRWWHFRGDDKEWLARCAAEPETNSAEFQASLRTGGDDAHGVVALKADRAIGWLKLCPAPQLTKLYAGRVYRTMSALGPDRPSVYVIACMLVAPGERRKGVGRKLIAEAVAIARRRGASAIEALPRRGREALRDDEVWMGPVQALEACGFEAVAGEDPYPVLRCVFA